MPQFIALGCSCVVKYRIDQIQPPKETLFFDRIVSNAAAVIEVLKTPREDMRRKLDVSRLRADPSRRHGAHCEVEMLEFGKAISYHDVPWNNTVADLEALGDRYARRHARLLDVIQGSEPIVFIHFTTSDMREDALVSTIRSLNPTLTFVVVIVGQETSPLENNLVRIKLRQTETPVRDAQYWQYNHLCWQDLWDQCSAFESM